MLLRSIRLVNFRQFIDEKIQFSVEPGKNVTLVMGNNGSGKTTLAQAFSWCLYGTVAFADKLLLNKKIENQLLTNPATVKVEIELTQGDIKYKIVRSQIYHNFNRKIKADNSNLSVIRTNSDGNTSNLNAAESETEVQNILPRELANYFFFDGEKIEKMSREITTKNKSSDFADAVSGLTGLKSLAAMIEHFDPQKSSSVIKKFEEDIKNNSNPNIEKLINDKDEYQNKLADIDEKLIENAEYIESIETRIKQYEDQLKAQESSRTYQVEIERAEAAIRSSQIGINNNIALISSIFNSSSKELTNFLMKSLAFKSIKKINASKILEIDYPELNAKTVEFVLKNNVCICGSEICEGDEKHEKLKSILEYLPPNSIGTIINSFKKDIKSKYSSPLTIISDMEDKIEIITDYDSEIETNELTINLNKKKLGGKDVSNKINEINSKINKSRSEKNSCVNQRDILNTEKGRLQGNIEELQKKIDESANLDKKSRFFQICKIYSERILENCKNDYSLKEKEIRYKLESYINELFKEIYDGDLYLEIDNKYNIQVFEKTTTNNIETSSAQSLAVIFAFITSIIKLAKEKSKEKEYFTEPYPLVMDAPLSAFDKKRIKAICESIPQSAEQIIMFIKDTDGDIAENYLSDKISKKFSFDKKSEVETIIMEA